MSMFRRCDICKVEISPDNTKAMINGNFIVPFNGTTWGPNDDELIKADAVFQKKNREGGTLFRVHTVKIPDNGPDLCLGCLVRNMFGDDAAQAVYEDEAWRDLEEC